MARRELAQDVRNVGACNSVLDGSSGRLMVAFHRGMREQGLSAVAALARAKRALLAAGGVEAAPRHWAPFVLSGLP